MVPLLELAGLGANCSQSEKLFFFAEFASDRDEDCEQRWDEQGPDHVEDPIGRAGVAGEFHVEDRFEAPKERGEHHRDDPAGGQAGGESEDSGDEDSFHGAE